jgi:hypothetical protein
VQSGMPAGHLLEIYEGKFKGADYSLCTRCVLSISPPTLTAHRLPARGGKTSWIWVKFSQRWQRRGAERRHPTGREMMGPPTLQPLQDPMLLF